MPPEPQSSPGPTLQALFDELASLSTADIDYHLISAAQDTISDEQHAEGDGRALSLHQRFHLPDEFERSQYLLEVVTAGSDDLASHFKNRNLARVDKLFPYSRKEGAKEHTPIYILAKICSILLQQQEPSFTSLRRLRCLRKDAPVSVLAPRAVLKSDDLLQQQMKAVREAWKEEFHGEHHEALHTTIQSLKIASLSYYGNVLPIIQSSGMGKSRVVRETAALVFTLPLNALDESETNVYPEPDVGVLKYFSASCTHNAENEVLGPEVAVKIYLGTLFKLAGETVLEQFTEGSFTSYSACALAWRQYLEHNDGENKKSLCRRVQQLATSRFVEWATASDAQAPEAGRASVKEIEAEAILVNAQASVDALQNAIDSLVTLPKQPTKLPSVRILLVLDEAGALSDLDPLRGRRDTEGDDENQVRRNYYDEFLSGFTSISSGKPMALVTLSTQSHLGKHARPLSLHWSRRATSSTKDQPPPYTEFPFDVLHRDQPIFVSSQMTFDAVSSTDFMCRFGRPLWSAQLNAARRLGLSQLNSALILQFAFSKLTGYDGPTAFENAARTMSEAPGVRQAGFAALSTRLRFNIDVGRKSARQAVMDLVTRNMRVVITIPQHREYMETDAPSEPILEEAACMVMNTPSFNIHQVLGEALEIGLAEKGVRGELVARLLLIRAFDAAVRRHFEGKTEIHWNTPVSVVSFLEALFHPSYHAVILDALPDNRDPSSRPHSQSLREAFKDARIRLTHFARFANGNPIDTHSGLAACVRGMGIWGVSTQVDVDFVIPIVKGGPNEPLCPEIVTFLLVQVKDRSRFSGVYAIDGEDPKRLNVFPTTTGRRTTPLPYISLVMELGQESVQDRRNLDAPAVPATNAIRDKVSMRSWADWEEKPSPKMSKHPRYSILAQGCSERIYRVIADKGERNAYAGLLAKRDLYDEHLRAMNIPLLKRMKAEWGRGLPFYDWTDLDPLRIEPR